MNNHDFPFGDHSLSARASGALWWAARGVLVVSDLHLGKSDRMARRGGAFLPPYETQDTLSRLEAEIEATGARTVICLGDSFDDLGAEQNLHPDMRDWILRLMAGREWIWVEGNHDPGPTDLGGTHRAEVALDGLTFRHIATDDGMAELSGHYHPKARIAGIARPCFLYDARRVILPAFGTYTGGLRAGSDVLSGLMAPDARAVLIGARTHVLPYGAC